jgi:two-component system sensor histidine kinase BaeS
MESFPLAELVEDVLDLHQAAAEAAGVRLQARIEAPGRVRGSPDRLRRLVENLLSNALRFSPPGGTVTLGLGQGKGVVRLWVEDEGPGIPLHQRSQVFERFWQADGARSGAEHHGLGLAIARAIAQAHGGQLWAEDGQAKQNGKPTGCQMILELPLQTGSDLPPSLFTSSPRVV